MLMGRSLGRKETQTNDARNKQTNTKSLKGRALFVMTFMSSINADMGQ